MRVDKTPKVKAYLDRALEHINSVSYRVSLRWVFYRVWQEGLLQDCWKKGLKMDIKTKKLFPFEENDAQYKTRCNRNFIAATAAARHKLYGGWKRDSVIDDTRNIIWKGIGDFDKFDWISNLSCNIDKFQNQDHVVLIMFEAQAMISQFEYLTKHIPLVPSSGEFTIDYKNSIALAIEELSQRYNKPVVVLYFGDCDEKGRKIRESALKYIREWCSVEFEDFYCGLTDEQAKAFYLESNPDKPNNYQWESLSDEQAKEIILPYVKRFQDQDKIEELEKLEQEILKEAKEKLWGDEE